MESKYGSRRKPGSSRGIWLAALLAFAAGGGLVGYSVWYSMSGSVEVAEAAPEEVASEASPTPDVIATLTPTPTPLADVIEAETVEEAAEAVAQVAEQQGGLDQRLAAAEQRLARLDLQAQAAAGNAARAEALLIAFAARRYIERGDELGELAVQLRQRFGDNKPNAVRTIIAFSRNPITTDRLLARLQGLGPELAEGNEITSWGDIQSAISDLFVIRREDTPSPQPQRRLERARLFLESGRIQAAIDEVQNLPGAAQAENWIADATRLRDVQDALDLLELEAVLEPRQLRDGNGNLIEQN